MTKQQVLITILTKLKSQRPLAEGFLRLLQSQQMNEEMTARLLSLIAQAISLVQSQHQDDALHHALHMVQHLQQVENREMDMQEAEDLLAQLN